MYFSQKHRLRGGLVVSAALLCVLAACSADRPTAPVQQPAPPPGSGAPSAAWNITITLEPSEIGAGSANPVTVRVQVRRADNGQVPAAGTTIVVETSLPEDVTVAEGKRCLQCGIRSQISPAPMPPTARKSQTDSPDKIGSSV